MTTYTVGYNKPYDGEPFATITEALDALHGDLIGKGKPCVQVHEQEVRVFGIDVEEECVPFLFRIADGTQHTVYLPKLPDDEQYHYCNGEIWVVPKTGFHNVSAADYIEVVEMVYEVGRKWRQFWSVQRAFDKTPRSLVGTGENRVICCEPRPYWWQRWLATVAHWGFAVKRWIWSEAFDRVPNGLLKLTLAKGDSVEMCEGFENKKEETK